MIAQNKELYRLLYKIDVESNGAASEVCNESGNCHLTVCPECHVDDFVHVEGCKEDTP
jgi:hypothetical protein